jgi:hypothetical protein
MNASRKYELDLESGTYQVVEKVIYLLP